MTKFSWKIGGEAGFGIMTTGLVFSKIASRLGYQIFDYVEYPSLIRGGHNTYEVVVGEEEVSALQVSVDYLVCLNSDTYRFHCSRLHKNSIVIYDQEDFQITDFANTVAVPFKKILHEQQGQLVMKNTIAVGASLALLGSDLAILNELIEKQFRRKGEAIVEFNKKFARMGHHYVTANYQAKIKKKLVNRKGEVQMVMTGNDAFSYAAAGADCRLFAAYPMTPSSSVLTSLAAWQEKTGMVVRHAEDEISVINTVLGASFAGVRAACATSGGGFALMVESLSFAGVAELPVVVFLSSRPGPATGMPTWTEQSDLLFAVHAGHGEFPKIVLAPGDIGEMIGLTAKAFNLADIYQTPVIVMSDMFLSESHKTISKQQVDNFFRAFQIERGKTISAWDGGQYLRYKLTDDGISERVIPGAKGVYYQANSYEHIEDGHTTEDAVARKQQVDKRNKKMTTYLKNHFANPKIYGDLNSAKVVFVSWGSTKGVLLTAQELLRSGYSRETALIHFTSLFPLNKEKVRVLFKKNRRYVLVENNSQAQFGKLLLMETGVEIKEKLLKYDGRPFWPEEIVNYVK
ncbi:2-oxoacid:acceptor oxidoreductase subunit alpha [Candidatus Roizmanbacteria bacterium]|nr:2-oxoacid:acceptor oxidoreductase subunit alpha [Candidatus Roizmanbacteria bacterium]